MFCLAVPAICLPGVTLAALIAQAEHQTSDIMPLPHHASASIAAQPPTPGSVHTDAVVTAKPASAEAQAKEPSSKVQLLKHINFWHEDELKLAHPEVQASPILWLAVQL